MWTWDLFLDLVKTEIENMLWNFINPFTDYVKAVATDVNT